MAVNLIEIEWTGTGITGPAVSTFAFDSLVGTAAQQASAVLAFLGATEDERANGCQYAINTQVRTLNTATGALEAVTSISPNSGSGTLAGDPLSPSTQGLLRLETGVVVNNRLVKGRLFLPGTTENVNQTPGTPIAAYRTDYEAAAAALIADANSAWCVWSRTHGQRPVITSANVWTKWAVLRSRRD
jgi:hypothetical protein